MIGLFFESAKVVMICHLQFRFIFFLGAIPAIRYNPRQKKRGIFSSIRARRVEL
jgi:hypothetical protein